VTVLPPASGSGPVIATPGAINLTLSVLAAHPRVTALPPTLGLTATLPQPRAVVTALPGSIALALTTQAAHPKIVALPGAVALVAALPAPHVAVTAHPDVIQLVIAVLPASAGGLVPDVRGTVTGYTVLVYGAGGGTVEVGGVGGFTVGSGSVDGGTA
jgi:hypothetical protein